MSSLQFRPFTGLSICILVLTWACSATAPAQETKGPLEAEKNQLELERQKLELEKKQLELQRKQLQMEEAARKELQIKETEEAVTMKLEGDVLFDFDKAEIRPEAEETLDEGRECDLAVSRRQGAHRRTHRFQRFAGGKPCAFEEARGGGEGLVGKKQRRSRIEHYDPRLR